MRPRLFFYIIIQLCWITSIYSQTVEVGIGGGPTVLFSDLGGGKGLGTTGPKDFDLLSTRYCVGGTWNFLNKKANLKFGLSLNYGQLSGNDKYSQNANRFHRQHHVWTTLLNTEVRGYWKPYKEWPIWVYSGFGVFHFNPKTSLNGTTYKLRNFGTEGQFFMPGKNPYSLWSYSIPYGIEFKVKKFKNNAELWVDMGFRKTFTDYIDDTHDKYVDKNQLLATNGPIAVALSDRNNNPIIGSGNAKAPRGNPLDMDNFMLFTVTYRKTIEDFKWDKLFTFKKGDKDKDGIKNYVDKCPETPLNVAVDEDGCPLDSDSDGVPDYRDKCPDEAGLKSFRGCPDKDNDKIADYKDSCPDEAGPIAFGGCPDTDGDGIPDKRDKCPNENGYEKWGGCPTNPNISDVDSNLAVVNTPKKPDTLLYIHTVQPKENLATISILYSKPLDLLMKVNNLKTVNIPAGSSVSIPMSPEEFDEYNIPWKRELKFAIRRLNFGFNSDNLTPESISELKTIIRILQEHPEVNIVLKGHTDSDGSDDYNQKLSERRCQSVLFYLTANGIKGSRITYKGYGEEKPLVPNTTPHNKALNRRVEMTIR